VNTSAGSHHHATTDSIERVGSKTSTNGNTPTKTERGKEATLKRTSKDDGLKRIVDTEAIKLLNKLFGFEAETTY